MMVVTNSTVAENAVCSCEGRKIRKNRREKDKGAEFRASGGPGISAILHGNIAPTPCRAQHPRNSFLTAGIPHPIIRKPDRKTG